MPSIQNIYMFQIIKLAAFTKNGSIYKDLMEAAKAQITTLTTI
jgi:hypothetical protein